LDHTLLTINIIIEKKFIQNKQRTIIKNSEEEERFISDLKEAIGSIDISNITDIESLEKAVQEYATILESLWNRYSKLVKITKHSKIWWNEEYNTKLNSYYISKFVVDWK